MTDEPSSDESVGDPTDEPARTGTAEEASDAAAESAASADVGAVAGSETGEGDDATAAASDPADANAGGPGREVPEEAGDREVVVPLRVYKTVTVFSTLLAVAAVVGGFVFIDRATNRATAANVDPVFAVAGIALIVAGAGIYAFSTRFRAEGMGKSKDDAAEDSGNG